MSIPQYITMEIKQPDLFTEALLAANSKYLCDLVSDVNVLNNHPYAFANNQSTRINDSHFGISPFDEDALRFKKGYRKAVRKERKKKGKKRRKMLPIPEINLGSTTQSFANTQRFARCQKHLRTLSIKYPADDIGHVYAFVRMTTQNCAEYLHEIRSQIAIATKLDISKFDKKMPVHSSTTSAVRRDLIDHKAAYNAIIQGTAKTNPLIHYPQTARAHGRFR